MRADVRLAAVAATATLLAAGCQTPIAEGESPAYEARLSDGGEAVLYHWPLGTTVRVFVDGAEQPQGLDLALAVRRGFAAWRDGLYYRDVDVALVSDPFQANVLVRWDDAPARVQSLACVSAHGYAGATNFCVLPELVFQPLPFVAPDQGRASAAYFEVTISTDRARIPDQQRLEGIVSHEIGHTLGIGTHSNEPSDLMFAGVGANGPTARDQRTLRWVMHQPSQITFPAPVAP